MTKIDTNYYINAAMTVCGKTAIAPALGFRYSMQMNSSLIPGTYTAEGGYSFSS
jgi:hypothetical protein